MPRRTRPASYDEERFFRTVERLLRETDPVVKRCALDSIRVPAGRMFVSSMGRLKVKPEITVLTNDTFFERLRTRYRDPDPSELERWRIVLSELIEKASPGVSDGRLIECSIPYGLLRMSPRGQLICIEEMEPTDLVLDIPWEQEVLQPPEPSGVVPEFEFGTDVPPVPVVAEEWEGFVIPGPDEESDEPAPMEPKIIGALGSATTFTGYRAPKSGLRHRNLERGVRFPCPVCGGSVVSSPHSRIPVAGVYSGGGIVDYRGAWMSRLDFFLPDAPKSMIHYSPLEKEAMRASVEIEASRARRRRSAARLAATNFALAKAHERAFPKETQVEFVCVCGHVVSDDDLSCPRCGVEFEPPPRREAFVSQQGLG